MRVWGAGCAWRVLSTRTIARQDDATQLPRSARVAMVGVLATTRPKLPEGCPRQSATPSHSTALQVIQPSTNLCVDLCRPPPQNRALWAGCSEIESSTREKNEPASPSLANMDEQRDGGGPLQDGLRFRGGGGGGSHRSPIPALVVLRTYCRHRLAPAS